MKEERLRILEMLQQGKVNAEEADRLLEALEKSYEGEAPGVATAAKTIGSAPGAVEGMPRRGTTPVQNGREPTFSTCEMAHSTGTMGQ